MVQGVDEGMAACGPEESAPIPALLARAQAGDLAAREALVDRYRPLLASIVARHARRLPPGALAKDDLWQEAYRHFLELVADYVGDAASFSACLKQVLDWRIANLVRAEQRRRRPIADEAPENLDLPEDERQPGLESPRLRAALRRLSPRQRAVLYHLHWEGRAAGEIAALLGLSPQAVTAVRRRAEGQLRRALKQSGRQGPGHPRGGEG